MAMKVIKTLRDNSILDHNCVFTAQLLEVKDNYAIILMDSKILRKKIYKNIDGNNVIYPLGKYSMCPIFEL